MVVRPQWKLSDFGDEVVTRVVPDICFQAGTGSVIRISGGGRIPDFQPDIEKNKSESRKKSLF